jgi:deoxycytidine triphosphate deaminase
MFELTGVYSNIQIKKAIENGHIVCEPLNLDHINGSSVDVTLGMHFYRIKDRRVGALVYNPYDKGHVDRHFEYGKAETHKEVIERLGVEPLNNVPLDQPVIHLEPGERILGHTHEFIGIKAPGTSSMQARSTTGRNGIAVCLDAGWGDPGYINRWTMEIYNMHQEKHMILPVGTRVAQLVFYHTGPVEGEYSGLSGKYQSVGADNIEELIASWKPDQMLPKAYKDVIKEYEPLACDLVSGQKPKEGVIINLEGLDGTGKGTQLELLKDYIKNQGKTFTAFDFPRYDQPTGKRIGKYLAGSLKADPYEAATLYADDRLATKRDIQLALERGDIVILNRYVPSNIAYQSVRDEIETPEQALALRDWIESLEYGKNQMPRATINIVLSSDINLSKKMVDKKGERLYINGRDVLESNDDLQARAAAIYRDLCKTRADFVEINCKNVVTGEMRTKASIHADVVSFVAPLLSKEQV